MIGASHQLLMNNIIEHYGNLLNACYEDRNHYREEEIAPFVHETGDLYDGKLMIVGRAVNGVIHNISKQEQDAYEMLKRDVIPMLGKSNMSWLDEHRLKPDGYNWKISSFWKVASMLSQHLTGADEDWYKHITYTNLYKIASDDGNPSEKLCEVQQDECINILKAEIETTAPQNVVFLTGMNWAKQFVEAMEVSNTIDLSGFKYVTLAANKDGRKYVVSTHPQGKNQTEQVNEITQALDLLKNPS